MSASSFPASSFFQYCGSNVSGALAAIMSYFSTENDLESADTTLNATISTNQANASTTFEKNMEDAPGTLLNPGAPQPQYAQGIIYMITNNNYANQIGGGQLNASTAPAAYTQASSDNQALITALGSLVSMVQGLLGQFPTTQQNLIQGMSSLNGIWTNLARLLAA